MRLPIVLLVLLVYSSVYSQDTLKNFNASRVHITSTGMKVLGSWGLVNLGTGIAGWTSSENGTSHRYFYQMNTLWGATNAGIAALSLIGVRKSLSRDLTLDENLKAQKAIERIYLINGGLDLVYIGTGVFLNSRGNSRDDAKLKGYGTSFLMQGALLLLFDVTMYSTHRTNGNKFRNMLQKTSLISTENGIGLVYNF